MTAEECAGIEDMIDMEPPCSAIKGKGHKIEQGRTEKNEKKLQMLRRRPKQGKINLMPCHQMRKNCFLRKNQ